MKNYKKHVVTTDKSGYDSHPSKHKTFITCVQRRFNVFTVGPTLYKCYTNDLCLLGCVFNENISVWSQRCY